MKQAFHKLAWGFLFVMFDFRINGLDVLPDIIGYVLFAVAAAQLGKQSEIFAQLRTMNIIIILLSLLTIYQRPETVNDSSNILGMLFGLLTTVIGLIVVYRIFQGVEALAVRAEQKQVELEAQRWRQAYLIVEIAGLLIMVLVFIPAMFLVAAIVLFIASLLVMVQIMRHMFHAGDVLQVQEDSYERE